MADFKKVQLVQLLSGKVNLIPLEEISDCPIIIPNEKLGFWVYEKSIPGGAFDGIGPEIKVRDLGKKDIDAILAKGGECFVEVDYQNRLNMPSNGLGNKKVVIHLNMPTEAEIDLM